MHGHELLATLSSLGSGHPAAAFLRHAERFPIADPARPDDAQLTPTGHATAEQFGARLGAWAQVRLFHSPVKRCRQTAEGIARGAAIAGCTVEAVAPEAVLGVDYIVDVAEAGRLTVLHGEHFVRLWLTGQVPSTVIRPAAEMVAAKLAYLGRRLQEPASDGVRLDLHVSHDWNILAVRELTLGVRHEDAGWLTFLDGLAFAAPASGRLQTVFRHHTRTQALSAAPATAGA
jgi:hypothetical protein